MGRLRRLLNALTMWEDPLIMRAQHDLETPLPKRETELAQPLEEPSAPPPADDESGKGGSDL